MYPLFIAATWSIFGENVQATQLVQVFVDALTPVVCYYLAGLVLGTGGALWGGLTVAAYPMLIWYSARIVTESLCTLFLSLGVFLFIKGYRRDKTATLMLSAGFLALATLTRATPFLIGLALAFLVFFLVGNTRLLRIRRALLFLVLFTLMVGIWTARNYYTLGEFIPLTTGQGTVFWGGSDPAIFAANLKASREAMAKNAAWMAEQGIRPPEPRTFQGMERYFVHMGLENYRRLWHSGPRAMAHFIWLKLTRIWYATEDRPEYYWAVALVQVLFAIPALVGVFLVLRNGTDRLPALILLGVVGYFAAVHMMLWPLVRYMVPAMPLVILFAGEAFGRVRFLQRVEEVLCGSPR